MDEQKHCFLQRYRLKVYLPKINVSGKLLLGSVLVVGKIKGLHG